MLIIKNLNVSINRRILVSNFSTNVNEGKLIVLMGTNGIGKTTLLKTLANLHLEFNGEILINGVSLIKLTNQERSRLVSVYLTDKLQLEYMKVRDIITLGRAPYTNFWHSLSLQDKMIVETILQDLELVEFEDRLFMQLSDGEKSRVLMARTFVQDTPIILLDEPMAYLDFLIRPMIASFFKKLANLGKVVIFTSHDNSVLKLVDLVWMMEPNRIIVDSPSNFIAGDYFRYMNT